MTVLRFANVLGTDIITPISHDLRKRLLPCIAGFDPLVQFVEEDDVVRALEFVTGQPRARASSTWPARASSPGARWPRSAVPTSCPLPPFRPRLFAAPLERLGAVQFPPEMEGLVRYGRGVDTSRLREAGFEYRYTSAGRRPAASPGPTTCAGPPGLGRAEYRYEQDVEQFFRHSPAVVRGIDG